MLFNYYLYISTSLKMHRRKRCKKSKFNLLIAIWLYFCLVFCTARRKRQHAVRTYHYYSIFWKSFIWFIHYCIYLKIQKKLICKIIYNNGKKYVNRFFYSPSPKDFLIRSRFNRKLFLMFERLIFVDYSNDALVKA